MVYALYAATSSSSGPSGGRREGRTQSGTFALAPQIARREIAKLKDALTLLGFPCGAGDALDEPTRDALVDFQIEHGLPPTGQPDDETRARVYALREG